MRATRTMAAAALSKRIRKHRANARHFGRRAKQLHKRAARLARRSLHASKQGRAKRAGVLMRNALHFKELAGRLKLRAKFSRMRVAAIQRMRRSRPIVLRPK
jgi:hypothetical protein